jgi:hypothetical protein
LLEVSTLAPVTGSWGSGKADRRKAESRHFICQTP